MVHRCRISVVFMQNLCDVDWDCHLWFWWLVFVINVFSPLPLWESGRVYSSALGGVCSTCAVLWVHCCTECPWRLNFDGIVQSLIFLWRFRANVVRRRSVFLRVLGYWTLFCDYLQILQCLILVFLPSVSCSCVSPHTSPLRRHPPHLIVHHYFLQLHLCPDLHSLLLGSQMFEPV